MHNNILISLIKKNLINYFKIPNETIELYYNNEHLLGFKTLTSYNINKNNNLKVKVTDTKTDENKDKNEESKK